MSARVGDGHLGIGVKIIYRRSASGAKMWASKTAHAQRRARCMPAPAPQMAAARINLYIVERGGMKIIVDCRVSDSRDNDRVARREVVARSSCISRDSNGLRGMRSILSIRAKRQCSCHRRRRRSQVILHPGHGRASSCAAYVRRGLRKAK